MLQRSYIKLEATDEETRCCGIRLPCLVRGAKPGTLHSTEDCEDDGNSRNKGHTRSRSHPGRCRASERHRKNREGRRGQHLEKTLGHTGGIDYQSTELRKYRDQARDEATKAAKEKAVALAQALGNQVGKTHSIEEVQQSDGYSIMGGL